MFREIQTELIFICVSLIEILIPCGGIEGILALDPFPELTMISISYDNIVLTKVIAEIWNQEVDIL